MEITLLDLFNIKRDIIVESTNDLIDYINSEEKYNAFLEKIYSIMYFDIEFFYLNDYATKILNVIGEYKSKYKAKNKIIENAIITNINIILNNKDKKELEYEYYNFQNELRGNIFKKKSEVLNAIIYDSLSLSELNDDIQYLNIKYFISSISYILEVCPEYINNDDELKNKISEILNSIKKINKSKENILLKKLKKQLRRQYGS